MQETVEQIQELWKHVSPLAGDSEANRAAGDLVATWKVQIWTPKTATKDFRWWRPDSRESLLVQIPRSGATPVDPFRANPLEWRVDVGPMWVRAICVGHGGRSCAPLVLMKCGAVEARSFKSLPGGGSFFAAEVCREVFETGRRCEETSLGRRSQLRVAGGSHLPHRHST